nr:MAG TPA: hypothetical protein [Caudoviricetes sp.]
MFYVFRSRLFEYEIKIFYYACRENHGYTGFTGYVPLKPALLSHKNRNRYVNTFGYRWLRDT